MPFLMLAIFRSKRALYSGVRAAVGSAPCCCGSKLKPESWVHRPVQSGRVFQVIRVPPWAAARMAWYSSQELA